MVINIKQLKALSQKAADDLGISYDDAARLVAFYSSKGDEPPIKAAEAGDYSGLYEAADALGVSIHGNKKRKAERQYIKELAKSAPAPEVVPVDCELYDGIPAELSALIAACIDSACKLYKIEDLCKASAERWQGVCMYVGRHLRQSGLLYDKEKTKEKNCPVYDAERVAALVNLWAELCTTFEKAPLACDFVFFSGVSEAWFYDNNGNSELTSSRVGIYKKLHDLQERGLSARLTDGRRNPTGTIFFLKNWHGWRDQREIVHTDGGNVAAAAALPVYDADAGRLIDKKP